jgi:uncharacterized protein (DUF885 family)
VEIDESTQRLLEDGIAMAKTAFFSTAQVMESQLLPQATHVDAFGPQRYALASREFLGEEIDMAATYQWGLDEVARLDAAQAEVAEKLRPGMSVEATKNALDEDERYLLHGTDDLQRWMQGKADEAIERLNGIHFDIAEPLRRIECKIADTHDGGIWYTEPSEDFSRPGRMWWSGPEGLDTFGTWRELTTVYHEGVPGHHLQLAQAIYLKQELNRWRRSGIWVSGHGEGWALYAEALMAEFGFLDDPGDLLGQLDSEVFRAVRVVIDIGLHCGFTAPNEVGGGDWTWDKAWQYFNNHVSLDPGRAEFELLRYFGWAGQAPSYKIGQQTWLDLRAEAAKQQGDAFDLKAFHSKAQNLGSLGLQTLKDAMLGTL